MGTNAAILIVDDDENIGNMLEEALRTEGYRPIRAYSGTEALMILEREKPDLILLDLMLPGLSGEDVLSKIKGIPAIIMSAKSDVDHKVKLLYEGACDYVTKPFVISELLARIAVVLRLYSSAAPKAPAAPENVISANGVDLDYSLFTATCAGKEVSLTRTETAILHILMLNAGRPLGKNTILDRIMDSTPDCTDRSLKQHISNIRKKLEAADGRDHIEAVYGIGFRFL
ncbi:MAG: response regulator transcription factor [Lachnospiraceae bacterium]|nr:response regulator transcription factor [Lachnospiraceae bacterium]